METYKVEYLDNFGNKGTVMVEAYTPIQARTKVYKLYNATTIINVEAI